MSNVDKSSLIVFLKDTCNSLEKNTLQNSNIQSINAFRELYTLLNKNNFSKSDFKDFMEFLFLYWFFYTLGSRLKKNIR